MFSRPVSMSIALFRVSTSAVAATALAAFLIAALAVHSASHTLYNLLSSAKVDCLYLWNHYFPLQPFAPFSRFPNCACFKVLSDGLLAILANSRDPSLPVTTHNTTFSFCQTDTYPPAALCLSTATLSSHLLLRHIETNVMAPQWVLVCKNRGGVGSMGQPKSLKCLEVVKLNHRHAAVLGKMVKL
ncbi:hypothetical protein CRG98_011235 [Punica granatum]|uniref:Uncharacterized protein n=1 Tax=Punica granatum TaxID=22663 RepID=A0A2I0KII4_PUNGR|nr:hypothetical protein CRG98_011235 [Punica granatum]